MLIISTNYRYNESMHYYDVLPEQIVRLNENFYTYSSSLKLECGSIITISIGRRVLRAIVVREAKKPSFVTKEISSVSEYCLPESTLKLIIWLGDYYNTHPSIVLKSILPKDLEKKQRVSSKLHNGTSEIKRTSFVLNNDQLKIVKSISMKSQGSVLLQGITGSGKTAIYAELAKNLLSKSRSSLILLPEIALTQQVVDVFSSIFPKVFVFHSNLSPSEKLTVWKQVHGETGPYIVIGARSALFLPFSNLGLIVVDEAHEPSYKQDKSPKYSALRAAGYLGKLTKSLVIFGSATPSVSERYLAESGSHPIFKLGTKARINTKNASISVVDMRDKSNRKQHHYLSDALISSISSALSNKKQTLIYHNRRGSRSVTLCEKCGWMALCDKCLLPMTLHADLHILKCRVCLSKDRVPLGCPSCNEPNIIHKGLGTKQIESDLKKLFPYAIVARFDGDNIKKDRLEQRYKEIYNGDIDILVGTQILAKGLDLPKLELVGVIQAESGLALPDYTSRERTFQLLAQVAGRVGRTENETKVIIQSFSPQDESIKYGASQDYESFYSSEIAKRQLSNFPPFTYMLLLTCSYKSESLAVKKSSEMLNKIKSIGNAHGLEILGPAPAFYERLGGGYRWQILIKSKKRSNFESIINIVPNKNWQVDIDPFSII